MRKRSQGRILCCRGRVEHIMSNLRSLCLCSTSVIFTMGYTNTTTYLVDPLQRGHASILGPHFSQIRAAVQHKNMVLRSPRSSKHTGHSERHVESSACATPVPAWSARGDAEKLQIGSGDGGRTSNGGICCVSCSLCCVSCSLCCVSCLLCNRFPRFSCLRVTLSVSRKLRSTEAMAALTKRSQHLRIV